MRDLLVGMVLGAIWVLWFFLAVDWWERHVTHRIIRWVRRRAERRLVRTGRWTPAEAAEIVAGWSEKNGSTPRGDR